MHDDDYYDADDDYYDDDEGSSRGLLIALVIVLILGVLAVFVAISILVHSQGGLDKFLAGFGQQGPVEQPVEKTTVEETTAGLGVGEQGGESTELEPMGGDPEESGPGGSEVDSNAGSDRSARERSSRRASDEADDQDYDLSEPLDDYEEPTPAPQRRSARSSRSSGRDDSGSSRSSSSGSSRRSSGGVSYSESSRSSRSDSSSAGSSSRSSERASVSRSEDRDSSDPSEDDTPRVLDDDDDDGEGASKRARREARSGGVTMNYDKDSISSLGSKARGGALSEGQVRALEAVPDDSRNFTLAWATVMKNAEAKRDYKGHCAAAKKLMTKPANKYHPEWNLEMAKCQMRTGRYAKAVKSADRTLGDPFGMTAATKAERLLLAYEIKAQSKTKIYDNHTKANEGLNDKNKLNSAIQAWMECLNYASGVGNSKAAQKAKREISDLEQRRGM